MRFSSLLTNFPSTTVENSLQITPFYAKQSQSQVGQNQHKYFCINEIRKIGQLVIQTKQTQFKPNKAKNKANLSQNKANSNPICRKGKIDAKFVYTKEYEENVAMGHEKTKPKQTQSPKDAVQKIFELPFGFTTICCGQAY